MKDAFERLFRTRTRAEWCALLEATDACFAPVLSLADAPEHPHNRARGAFVTVDGQIQPAPAPRYAGTPTGLPRMTRVMGEDTRTILATLGYDAARIDGLKASGVIGG
jgi:alpha-methylacyl-CoA racemase